MSFRLNRKELAACAAMPLSKYKTLRERGHLPFIDEALSSEVLEEKQDRRQRRFTPEHAMCLRAHDELTTSGTMSAEGAGLLVINIFDHAVQAHVKATAGRVWFGAVFASADHGGFGRHVVGNLAEIERQLADAASEWSENTGFSQTRLILLSLDEIFASVKRTADEIVHDFPATLDDAIAASRT